MPAVTGLIGENVHRVLKHLHARRRVFDHDGAGRVADDPVKQRGRPLGRDGLIHNHGILKSRGHLVHGCEICGDPQRELPRRDVRLTLDGRGRVLGVTREVEARHGKTRVIAGVEEQRLALLHNAHADQGVRDLAGGTEGRGRLEAARHHERALAVIEGPIQIAAEKHPALSIVEAHTGAHEAGPFVTGVAGRRPPAEPRGTRPHRAKTPSAPRWPIYTLRASRHRAAAALHRAHKLRPHAVGVAKPPRARAKGPEGTTCPCGP